MLAGLGALLPLAARVFPRLEPWLVRPTALPSLLGGLAFAAAAAGVVWSGRSARWSKVDTGTWSLAFVSLASLGAVGSAPVTVGMFLYGVAVLLAALRVPAWPTMIAAGVAALAGTVVRAVASQGSPTAVVSYAMVVVPLVLAHMYLASATHYLVVVLSEREALLADRRDRPSRHRERTSSPGLALAGASVRTLRGATPAGRETEREATSGGDDAGWEGLVDRIRASIATLCDDAGVSATVHAEVKGLAPPSSKMRQGVMKVTQEAASHALREAEARRIAVTLRRADGGLVLEVEDDGTGNEGGRSRKALAAIRGRVASLGGSAEVKRAAAGWVMRVKLPCEQLN